MSDEGDFFFKISDNDLNNLDVMTTHHIDSVDHSIFRMMLEEVRWWKEQCSEWEAERNALKSEIHEKEEETDELRAELLGWN